MQCYMISVIRFLRRFMVIIYYRLTARHGMKSHLYIISPWQYETCLYQKFSILNMISLTATKSYSQKEVLFMLR